MNTDDCVIWHGRKDSRGYGRRSWGSAKGVPAHRVAYIEAFGAVPDGMTVDHLCFNPPCVNPQHLRLLTRSENSQNQRSAAQTHCSNGHEYTPANTYFRTSRCAGRRQCRTCNRDAVRRYKERKSA